MEERTREELVLITLIVFKIWWSVNRTLNLAESLDCLLDHLGDIQGFCFLEIEKQCLGLLFIGNWKTLYMEFSIISSITGNMRQRIVSRQQPRLSLLL